MTEKENDRLIISHLTLRKVIGILGVSYAFVLALGCVISGECSGLLPSVSDYYHTIMRNLFVGFLFVIGLFLYAYKGYNKTDNLVGNLACIFALCIALFPNKGHGDIVKAIHFSSAGLFFGSLSYFSLVLFTKSDQQQIEGRKKQRNIVFRVCGILMLLCILLLTLYFLFLKGSEIDKYRPVYLLEAIALLAFGISWLTKGEILLKDLEKTS